jgi:methyl-accepting chemotaxis protein
MISVLGALAIISVVLIGVWLNNRLLREVGAAAARIQSSSDQLEAAAGQQAAGGRHHPSAMEEITVTISELMITSRRIADTARQVSAITEDTLREAAAGDATLDQTRVSIAAVCAQVDRIVTRMLALDGKSEQFAGVTALVSELAEQTNILAVNATIEADGGDKFAAEIHQLADRTVESARQIRALIDDLRDAVNGARAVGTAAQQCGQATVSLRRIAALVSAANEAGREIERFTEQQSSAVEQVNIAAGEAAVGTRQSEADAVQTRKTAAHLSSLSRDLRHMVGAVY